MGLIELVIFCFFLMSRTMCSWNPLGKPIVRGSVLVVRGCGGMRGTS